MLQAQLTCDLTKVVPRKQHRFAYVIKVRKTTLKIGIDYERIKLFQKRRKGKVRSNVLIRGLVPKIYEYN